MFVHRWFRLVLCVFTLPLALVFATPSASLAATTASVAWSGTADVTPEVGFESTGSCTGNARYSGSAVDGVSVEGSYRCVIFNDNETDPDSLDSGGGQITVHGTRTDGAGCAFAASATGDPLAGVSYETNVVGEGCEASEVCLSAFGTWTRSLFSDVNYNIDVCVPIALGPLPEDVGGCQFGTPMGVFEEPKWVPFPSLPDSHGRWEIHVKVPIMSMTVVDGWAVSMLSASQQWVADIGNVTDTTPWGAGGVEVVFTYSGWAANGSVPTPKFMTSVEVYHELENWQTDHASHAGYQSASGWQIPGSTEPMPPGRDRPFMGSTQPLQCRFYFGPKLFNAEGTDADDPAGEVSNGADDIPPPPESPPVEIPPPPTPPPGADQCGDFSLTDPTTWANAAMCAAVGILGKIWDTIKALPKLILDGLKDLFIPDEGFLDNRLNTLSTAWDNTAVGKFTDALSELQPGSVSGCSGLPLNVDLGGGVVISESLGSACGGNMATIAGMVRMSLSAVVVVGGAMACVRAVGSGFGWDPGIGRGV